MIASEYRDEGVDPEGVGLNAEMWGCGKVGVTVDQRDVNATLEEQADRNFGFGLGDVQSQIWMEALQRVAEWGGQRREGTGERSEVDGASGLSGTGVQAVLGSFESREHFLRVLGQLAPGRSEMD
ncbi:hypothetical protein OHA35_44305 [Streptomyces sp. NBC_00233]|nr:hypothetical protein [Streptomyces sp. NBC_00233]MCX5233305.1 hypothetical protein [Streptomyces sp. NBC_00233]